jgi:ferredoxin-NADP reductase
MTASIDEYSLRHTVPDLKERDLYVCGPEAFVTGIVEIARSLGLPDEVIHHEAFAL